MNSNQVRHMLASALHNFTFAKMQQLWLKTSLTLMPGMVIHVVFAKSRQPVVNRVRWAAYLKQMRVLISNTRLISIHMWVKTVKLFGIRAIHNFSCINWMQKTGNRNLHPYLLYMQNICEKMTKMPLSVVSIGNPRLQRINLSTSQNKNNRSCA